MTAHFNPADLTERDVARVLYDARERVFGLGLNDVVHALGHGAPGRAVVYSVLQMFVSLGLVNSTSTYPRYMHPPEPVYWLTAEGVAAWEIVRHEV
jgi:Fe2+ or Zn2+ uptake regulation protein